MWQETTEVFPEQKRRRINTKWTLQYAVHQHRVIRKYVCQEGFTHSKCISQLQTAVP